MYILKRHIIGYIFVLIVGILATYLMTTVLYDIKYEGTIRVQENQLGDANAEYEEMLKEQERLNKIIEKYRATDIDDLEDEVDRLNKELDSAKDRIEQLTGELDLSKAEIEKLSNMGSNTVFLGEYSVMVDFDEEEASNIVNAIRLLDGTNLAPSRKVDIYSIIGPYNSKGYELNESAYAIGVEYLTECVYQAAVDAGLDIIECNLNKDQMVLVDSYNDLVIKNNTNRSLKLHCSYVRGLIRVYIVA